MDMNSDTVAIISTKAKEILQVEDDLADDEDLTIRGLTSYSFIQLVVNLEIAFDIVIDDEKLLMENFTTITKIYDVIRDGQNERPKE
ncbi:phosphopantetheine-binding protein [Cohnella soli]|uniref:Phosphopantetheine-binding protein n=1 Tax=Cohnella soli TaxID=425005 RepID=A0ABW0I423_9BACL